jgi:hypothetical protein
LDAAGISTEQQEAINHVSGGNILDARSLYQHDPVYVILRDKLHLNDYIIAGIAIITSVVILFGLGALFHLTSSLEYLIRSLLQTFIVSLFHR